MDTEHYFLREVQDVRERTKRKALVKARLLMGLSQEKLAERIGVTRNTISEWERGVQHPYPLHVHALCILFGQSAQELAIDARWRELEPHEVTETKQGANAEDTLSPQEQPFLHSYVISNSSIPLASPSSLAHVIQLPQKLQTTEQEMISAEQGRVVLPSEYGALPLAYSLQVSSLDIAAWFGTRVNDLKAFGAYWHESTISCQQQQEYISIEMKNWNKMTEQDHQPTNEYLISRRVALAMLATISSSLLAKASSGSLTTFVIEEFLAQCTTSITTCWHLLQGRELAIVQRALTPYLPVLRSWAKQPSSHQQTSAYLAAQGCLLMGLLSLHYFPMPQNFQKRAFYCTQATEYASLSADPHLQITALTHLGNAYYDMGQRDKMLQTYQKALSTLSDLSKKYQFSSLLCSKLQVELAHAYAQHGQVQKSLEALEEARILFSNEGGVTPVFISTDYGHHSLILFEGLTHLDLEKYAPENKHSHQAADALAQVETVLINEDIPERFRIEIINQQALAAVRENNFDDFRRYLLEGIVGAKELGSEKRRQETITNWKEARIQWPHEKRIVELADVLF